MQLHFPNKAGFLLIEKNKKRPLYGWKVQCVSFPIITMLSAHTFLLFIPSIFLFPSHKKVSPNIFTKMTTPSTTVSLSFLFFFFSVLLLINNGECAPFACAGTRDFGFCRTNLGIAERVRDLIGRLTLSEKVKLLVNNAAAVPRLGIKGYEWWSEALHGVSDVGPGTKFGGEFPAATSFPQVITTAASFNASLWEEIGRVINSLTNILFSNHLVLSKVMLIKTSTYYIYI